MRPLVPYVQVNELVLLRRDQLLDGLPPFDVALQPFGALVAAGVCLGVFLAVRHGRRLGLDQAALLSFIVWILGFGFVGGHVLDAIFYYPEHVAADPLSLLRLWEGLSSYGGFAGALAGAFLWKRSKGLDVLPYADVVAASLPIGFGLGRIGCSLVHDHPGLQSDAWFAVRYPGGGRFDLGLYELAVVIPLAVTFVLLKRRSWPAGFYVGLAAIAYAPSRFALDFLRARDLIVADARYAALTPAQWASVVVLAVGLMIFLRSARCGGAEAPGL